MIQNIHNKSCIELGSHNKQSLQLTEFYYSSGGSYQIMFICLNSKLQFHNKKSTTSASVTTLGLYKNINEVW